ncbi:hypothetical protein RN51_02764 [Microbacterium oxydans]|uniref:DUF998 domain-containing protein n=1 Tax=Microbacterium oxydans TaxID=82380 RepID=A0A0F0KMQ4_9MICO|nr:DUF998 domain-containing protein [Microbacterium oxydans]KJL20546.1 hypothetical protein RN51_02764 [Microbacterium oxydans]
MPVENTTPDTARDTAAHTASDALRAIASIAGSVLVAAALTIIWVARMSIDRVLYVSGLGADGEPTAGWFAFALLLLAVGGFSVAWAARGLRSTVPWLSIWTPSFSVAMASALFLVASQVTCTTGCPLPVGLAFTWQDLVHTTVAVLAFALAAFAMLQVSFVEGRRTLRVLSLVAGVSTAVIAGAGGILSLLQFRTDIGSILELVATTIGMGWLAVLGMDTAIARRRRPRRATWSPAPRAVALHRSTSRGAVTGPLVAVSR